MGYEHPRLIACGIATENKEKGLENLLLFPSPSFLPHSEALLFIEQWLPLSLRPGWQIEHVRDQGVGGGIGQGGKEQIWNGSKFQSKRHSDCIARACGWKTNILIRSYKNLEKCHVNLL